MKNAIKLFGLLAVLMLLIACGGNEGEQNEVSNVETEQQSIVETDESAEITEKEPVESEETTKNTSSKHIGPSELAIQYVEGLIELDAEKAVDTLFDSRLISGEDYEIITEDMLEIEELDITRAANQEIVNMEAKEMTHFEGLMVEVTVYLKNGSPVIIPVEVHEKEEGGWGVWGNELFNRVEMSWGYREWSDDIEDIRVNGVNIVESAMPGEHTTRVGPVASTITARVDTGDTFGVLEKETKTYGYSYGSSVKLIEFDIPKEEMKGIYSSLEALLQEYYDIFYEKKDDIIVEDIQHLFHEEVSYDRLFDVVNDKQSYKSNHFQIHRIYKNERPPQESYGGYSLRGLRTSYWYAGGDNVNVAFKIDGQLRYQEEGKDAYITVAKVGEGEYLLAYPPNLR